MTAKRPHSVQTPPTAGLPPLNLVSELVRRQFAVASESTGIALRGSEAVREIQQLAAHRASARHQEAARGLRAAREPAQVLALQADLLRSDLQEVTRYWQQLAAATLNTQVELMSCATRALPGQGEAALAPMIESWQTALLSPGAQVPAVFKPVLESWQAMLSAAPGSQAKPVR